MIRGALDGTDRAGHVCVAMTRPLTAKQEAFAMAVAMGSTKADAYRANYKTEGWTPEAIQNQGTRTASVPAVFQRIRELSTKKAETASGEFDMTVKRLLQTYIEIAFTDPNELTRMRVGACRHCWGVGGAYQWKEHEYAAALVKWQLLAAAWARDTSKGKGDEPPMPDPAGGFGYRFTADPNPECVECEGEGIERMRIMDTTKLSPGAKHLYRGVQSTKDGIKILFGDKDKALESIGRMLGAFDDRLRVDLKAAVAHLHLDTKDPREAAAVYERMIRGIDGPVIDG